MSETISAIANALALVAITLILGRLDRTIRRANDLLNCLWNHLDFVQNRPGAVPAEQPPPPSRGARSALTLERTIKRRRVRNGRETD